GRRMTTTTAAAGPKGPSGSRPPPPFLPPPVLRLAAVSRGRVGTSRRRVNNARTPGEDKVPSALLGTSC
ncbi:hypothetical protein NHX12_013002, partial [Muraenolepis orangiensis]